MSISVIGSTLYVIWVPNLGSRLDYPAWQSSVGGQQAATSPVRIFTVGKQSSQPRTNPGFVAGVFYPALALRLAEACFDFLEQDG